MSLKTNCHFAVFVYLLIFTCADIPVRRGNGGQNAEVGRLCLPFRITSDNFTCLITNLIVCSESDVRRPSSFERIAKCNVIEGNLLIVMTTLPESASAPNLREITGFLVVYDLARLDGLSNLFPNLTVIRGQSLIYNFALVIRSTTLKVKVLRFIGSF